MVLNAPFNFRVDSTFSAQARLLGSAEIAGGDQFGTREGHNHRACDEEVHEEKARESKMVTSSLVPPCRPQRQRGLEVELMISQCD